MEDFPRPVTMMIVCTPELMASSTPYWIRGLSTKGSISFGWAFVAGRNLVPSPAAGNTALRTFEVIHGHCTRLNLQNRPLAEWRFYFAVLCVNRKIKDVMELEIKWPT